jgi:hypothetical protein
LLTGSSSLPAGTEFQISNLRLKRALRLHDDFDISFYGNDNAQGGEEKDVDVNSWDLD